MSHGKRLQSIAPLAEKDLLADSIWLGKMCIFSATLVLPYPVSLFFTNSAWPWSIVSSGSNGPLSVQTSYASQPGLSTAGISSSPHWVSRMALTRLASFHSFGPALFSVAGPSYIHAILRYSSHDEAAPGHTRSFA